MMEPVPMNDLGRALACERDALMRAFSDVIASGWLVQGPQHESFEAELANFLDVPHVLGVASGTDALELAMRAAMPAGRSTVVATANCGGYAATAARRAGFAVGYVDIDPDSLLLDIGHLASVVSDSVGIVVVTHLYGRAADVGAVRRICEPHGVVVLEDCAQALGAIATGGRVGSLGDVAALSFYPTKNLGALGDGGAVATRSSAIANRLRALRQYGWGKKYTIDQDGGRNSRLDEVQAAVLRMRLSSLDEGNQRRRDIITAYREASSDRLRVLPVNGEWHVGHLAVVVTDERDKLRGHLAAHLIQCDVHYPVPDHLQPAFAAEYALASLPVTLWAASRVLSVPVFPEMRDDEIARVADALAAF